VKLIVAGSRHLDIWFQLVAEFASMAVKQGTFQTITEVVSGGANGADAAGEVFASEYNLPIKRFEADWEKYGKSAGPKRNKQMAEYGDALLLIWDGKSRGSKNMRDNMLLEGKPIYEVILPQASENT
jgi:hypothetical protein